MSSTDIIEIKHPSGATATLHPLGATLLSYQTASGRSVLFCSRDAKLDGSKAVRGGVPLVFPIFGPAAAPSTMPQHGYARVNYWKLVKKFDNNDFSGVEMQLELKDALFGRGTNNPWAVEDCKLECSLHYTVEIKADTLMTRLRMHNTGSTAFDVQALFHTYYQVANHKALDGSQCFVNGLEGYTMTDKVTSTTCMTGPEPVTIAGETDRVYTPDTKNDLDVVIGVGIPNENVTLDAAASVDGTPVPVSAVVWNPHETKAAAMGDFGSDQYVDMICFEPGMLNTETLEPGKEAILMQRIRV